jgi:hypothetical protein
MNRSPTHPQRRLASKIKKIALLFGATCLALLLSELTIRAILAVRVGPHVLAYGMNLSRGQAAAPFKDVIALRRTHESEINVGSHSVELTNYSKYVPNETRRDIDEHGTLFKVTINSRGFRGGEFTDEKRPGTVRVLTLGASSTFGYHDRDDETYPHYLQQMLNERCKSNAYEVINLGIPHLTADNIYSLFIAEGLPLNPDIVTF